MSHASEDSETTARPLALSLQARGFDVWFDEFVLRVGDSLLERINGGLRDCNFGIVILSKAFFAKKWPKLELAGLVAKEVDDSPVVLPVWHELTVSDVAEHSPVLADRLAVSTSQSMSSLVDRIVASVRSHGGSRRKRLLDTEFLISYRIPGVDLFNLIDKEMRRQHNIPYGADDHRLSLWLYEDGSGLDEYRSSFILDEGVDRGVREDDLLSILSEQPYVPLGYSVQHIEFDTELIVYGQDRVADEPIDCRDVPRVHITAVLDQAFLNSDEIVQFIAALTRFKNYGPYFDGTSLWWGISSPGRSAVRRLLELGRLGEIVNLIQPSGDRNVFLLATAIVKELSTPPTDLSALRVVELLSSDRSPLNDHWRIT